MGFSLSQSLFNLFLEFLVQLKAFGSIEYTNIFLRRTHYIYYIIQSLMYTTFLTSYWDEKLMIMGSLSKTLGLVLLLWIHLHMQEDSILLYDEGEIQIDEYC